jgi:hypothetical protein
MSDITERYEIALQTITALRDRYAPDPSGIDSEWEDGFTQGLQ